MFKDAAPTDSPVREYRSLATVFGLLYFIQGICEPSEGLIAQPMRSALSDRGATITEIGLFSAMIGLPWSIKPLYGLLSDFVPLWGMWRRSYLLVANMVAAIGLIGVALIPLDFWSVPALAVVLIVPTIAVALADVVIDAVMVEEGQPHGWTGRLQSVQWAALYGAAVLTGVLGGWLSELNHERIAILICGVSGVVATFVTYRHVREPQMGLVDRASWATARRSLLAVFTERRLIVLAVFLFLWNFNPFAASVLQNYMIHEKRWSETFFGETISWQAAGCVVGSIIYGRWGARWPAARLFQISIVAGVASTALYVAMMTPNSARMISVISGIVYMFGNLATLDLAARSCHPSVAATTFSTLMAISNLGISLSAAVGGWLTEHWQRDLPPQSVYERLVLIGAASTAACWLLTPWFGAHKVELFRHRD